MHRLFSATASSIAPNVQEALADIGLDRQARLIRRWPRHVQVALSARHARRRETDFNHDGWTAGTSSFRELTERVPTPSTAARRYSANIGGDRQIQGGPGLRYRHAGLRQAP